MICHGAREVVRLLKRPHQVILEGHEVGGEVGRVADGGDDQPLLAQFGADPRQVRGVVARRFVGHAQGLVHVGGALAPVLDLPGGVDVGGLLCHLTQVALGRVADARRALELPGGLRAGFNLHRVVGAEEPLLAGVTVRGRPRVPIGHAIGVRADVVHQAAVAGLLVAPVEAVAPGQFVGVDGHPIRRPARKRGQQPAAAGPKVGGGGHQSGPWISGLS